MGTNPSLPKDTWEAKSCKDMQIHLKSKKRGKKQSKMQKDKIQKICSKKKRKK